MANDDRLKRKVMDDGNTKSKKKNASPASISGSPDASGLRRSGRETPSRKQASESPSSTRKNGQIEKEATPITPPIKKKPEKIDKQTGESPLRRSDRGKKHFSPGSSGSKKLAASPNGKSENEKKSKRMTARSYKALFKPQRRRIEADDDKDQEGQEKSPQANTTSGGDVDKGLKSPDKLPRLDSNKSGCSLEDRDDVVGKCSDEVGERLMDLDQVEHVGCPSQTKPLDGKSTDSGNEEKQIGGKCSSSDRINHDLENQQELDSCDKACDRDLSVPSGPRVAESIWDTREVELSDSEGSQKKQYFLKYEGLAHIHNKWVNEAQLLIEAPLLVENYNNKDSKVKWNKAWTMPHQLLKKRLLLSFKPLNESQENACKVLNYRYEWLVKWQGLDHGQATWELEIAVLGSPEGENLIKEYENRHGKMGISSSTVEKTKEPLVKSPTIPAGGPLGMDQIHLNYVKKLHDSWTKGQNRVVFDNQERVMRIVLFILSLKGVTHPFLIITTSGSLSQWETMFLHVAPSNDFKVSVEVGETQRSVRLLEAQKEDGQLAFQVLLYPVDAFVEDLNTLKNINWEAIMVDESQCSEISTHFDDIKSLSTDKRFLLFGGPLVESMAEYLNVLSLLGCDGALSNNTRSKTELGDNLGKLKETLSRHIAYECKSDSCKFVEFWVPVQISNVQLEQYCATLFSSAMVLRSCSKSDTVGALQDILISNRKCCDHPYIVDPDLQNSIMKGLEPTMLLDTGIKASGKLQFLDLVLPEVKKRQLRVVILFQPTSGIRKGFASVGDILDDFVHQRFGQDSYERLDGVGIFPSKKQAALNNFNKDMSRFIFLLEHRVCQPSIKLSSVDIIVVFDSDLNPANDLRALQKISIDSRSEQIMIFRLYSSFTLEEKILRLAEQNMAIDSKLQYLTRSTCDALLMWGASDLFNKLTEFHSASVKNISSEESFLKDVLEEFLYLISHKCKSKDTAKPIITRVQSCGTYGKNPPLHSETKTQLPVGEQPQIFWRNLLEGRHPRWKFVSVSTARQRKRPHYFGDSSKETSAPDADVGKKRKKTLNTSFEPAAAKPIIEVETGGANEGPSGVPAHNESQASSAIRNEAILHDLLKPTVSELCEFLKFPEDLKIMVEMFLKFVLENYQVSKEHTSTLQAFMISLCWIGSSLSKFKIDRRESFALAKKHLNFSCTEKEANSVYSKLEIAKEMFLRHTQDQEKCQHDQNVAGKDQEEIEKFNRGWDEKRVHLENEYHLDKALIRTLHSNPSVRAEKLKLLDQEFAENLEENVRMRETQLKDLKATLLAGEEQMAANRVSSFIEGRADNDNQMVHSGDREKGAQDGLEAAPTSSGNLVEVQSNDKPVHDMHPSLVVPSERSISLEDPDGGRDEVNGMRFEEGPGTTVEPSNRVGNSPDGANESTGSHSSEEQMADATVLSVPVGDIPAKQHDGIDNNVAVHDDSVESGVPKDDSNQENAIGGTSSPVLSHGVEDCNETGPSDTLHVDSAEMGMPAGNSNKDNGEDRTLCPHTSHVEDRNDSCDSSSSNSPSAAVSQDQTPSIEPFASPASDHMPTILENQNEQPVDAGQVGPINSADPSLEPNDELSFPLSNLAIAENRSDIPPASGILLETPYEEPTITCFAGGASQSAENHANPSDHANLEEPLLAAETPLGENQPRLPSSDAAHDQPNVEPDSAAQNPEPPPSLNAEIQNQNAPRPELNLFDVQGSDHIQVASRMPNQADPLQAELERLCAVKDNVIKFHEDTRQRLKTECEKEIAEMLAQINLKYEAKRLDAEAAFHSKKKELDVNLNRVMMNKILAEAFRSKCQDLTSSGQSVMQQVTQGGLMQQMHRFSAQPSMRRSHGIAQPPLQIVHQSAALFSSTPSRPPANIPPYSTPSRPAPNLNPSSTPPLDISPYSTPSRPAPNTTPINPSSTPPPSVNSITPSSTVSRAPPPGINSITHSSMPIRPPPHINPITPSAGNLRVSSESRGPAPHIRPMMNMRASGSSEIRAPAPHIRPFRPSASVSPDFASYQMLPSQHLTSSLPLTSPSNSQAPAPSHVCLSDDD